MIPFLKLNYWKVTFLSCAPLQCQWTMNRTEFYILVFCSFFPFVSPKIKPTIFDSKIYYHTICILQIIKLFPTLFVFLYFFATSSSNLYIYLYSIQMTQQRNYSENGLIYIVHVTILFLLNITSSLTHMMNVFHT